MSEVGEQIKCNDCAANMIRRSSAHMRCDKCSRERARLLKRIGYQRNIEKLRAIAREKSLKRYHANKDRVRAQNAEWRARNPDKVAAMHERIKERRRGNEEYKKQRREQWHRQRDAISESRRKRRAECEEVRQKDRERNIAYRKANALEIKQKVREHYIHNRDKIKRRTKEWASKNPEKVKGAKKKYAARTIVRKREKGREYSKRNIEELRPVYVRGFLAASNGLRTEQISPDIVELKTLQLRIVRAVREGTKKQSDNA